MFTNSAGKATTSVATLVVKPAIQALYLVDVDNGRRLFALTNGMTINLATLPTRSLTIEAVPIAGAVGSIVFNLDNSYYHTENYAPYDLFGDNGVGHFVSGKIATGHHVLTVTPFSQDKGRGQQGPSFTVHFTVI